MKKFVKGFVKDVATLKRPVTAAALIGAVVTLTTPFGIHLHADQVSSALVAIGTVAAFIEHLTGKAA